MAREWSSGPPPAEELAELPIELVKAVWKELRAQAKRQERSVTCKEMFPLVRSCWRIESLDLCDASKWLTDVSLRALVYAPALRTVRLTSCQFVTDDGLSFAPQLAGLTSLDVSWTEVGDDGIASSIARCTGLTSLNLTGLAKLTDRAVSSLLGLSQLERLSLACTRITDAALDYLTYYTLSLIHI